MPRVLHMPRVQRMQRVQRRWRGWPCRAVDPAHDLGRGAPSRPDDRPGGGDFEADLSGIQALAGALKVNRSLNSVDLRSNSIPDEGKQQLRDAVKDKNITLQL